ncbi:MAG: hypothetical protein ACOCV8_03125 [Spirochaetota bacterium]
MKKKLSPEKEKAVKLLKALRWSMFLYQKGHIEIDEYGELISSSGDIKSLLAKLKEQAKDLKNSKNYNDLNNLSTELTDENKTNKEYAYNS